MRRRISTPLQERLQARLKAHPRPKRRESPVVLAERKKRKARLDLKKRESAKEMRQSEKSRFFGGKW